MTTRSKSRQSEQQEEEVQMDQTKTMQQMLPDENEQQEQSHQDVESTKAPTDDNDNELVTPTKQKIPKDDSFKTCKAEMPVGGAARRQLRMTPARNSILSGQQPFKEANSSSKKFNRRRKVVKNGQDVSKLNDTAGSHETFVAREQDLLFDRDSLDTHPPSARRLRISSTPKPCFERTQPTVTMPKPPATLESEIKPIPAKPRVRESGVKPAQSRAGVRESTAMPAKPRIVESRVKPVRPPRATPMAESRFKAPQSKPFNRFVTPRNNNFSTRYCESAKSSIFKRPNNGPGALTRTQSFKSTAELERDYFTSLRSRI